MKILYITVFKVPVKNLSLLLKIFSVKKNEVELPALTLMDKLLPVLEEKKYALCVFLDYFACFYTLSRSLVYDKLERYVKGGARLDYIKPYFANMLQYVYYDTVKSCIICQELGVAQGSKTGLIAFDMFSSNFFTYVL